MTLLAIAMVLVFSVILYYAYYLAFSFLVGFAASYEPSLGQGIGALVLVLVLPYGMAFFGAALIVRRVVPTADPMGLRYGVIVFLLIFCGSAIAFAFTRGRLEAVFRTRRHCGLKRCGHSVWHDP